jgi:hypothetical protein
VRSVRRRRCREGTTPRGRRAPPPRGSSGAQSQPWLTLKNGTVVGLFAEMFAQNTLTFNPGWDGDAKPVSGFTDVREPQA